MKRLGLTLLLFWLPLPVMAELVVVMAADADVERLTELQVRQLFTGKTRTLGSHLFTPMDLPRGHQLRERFYRQLAGKSPQQMRSYWARMMFTGKGHPLREVSSMTEMVLLVSSATDYIGYIDSARLNDELRVVFRFP